MRNLANRVKAIQQKNDMQPKSDITLLNSVEIMNEISLKNPSSFRLSFAAKRMLILQMLDKTDNVKDRVLLIKTLNEIDALEDKSNGGVRDRDITFTWASTATDADVIKDS